MLGLGGLSCWTPQVGSEAQTKPAKLDQLRGVRSKWAPNMDGFLWVFVWVQLKGIHHSETYLWGESWATQTQELLPWELTQPMARCCAVGCGVIWRHHLHAVTQRRMGKGGEGRGEASSGGGLVRNGGENVLKMEGFARFMNLYAL